MEASKAMCTPYTGAGGEEVRSIPVPKGSRLKRVMSRRRASLVIDLDWTRRGSPASSSIPPKKGSDCAEVST